MIGYDMFWSLAQAKGEELLKAEPLMMKNIVGMCGDNNWRIRRDAAKYLNEFLKELHKYKRSGKKASDRSEDYKRNSQLAPDRSNTIFGGSMSPESTRNKRDV
jgi:hypothetical protein